MKISYPIIIAVRINALARGFIDDAFYRIYGEKTNRETVLPPPGNIFLGIRHILLWDNCLTQVNEKLPIIWCYLSLHLFFKKI